MGLGRNWWHDRDEFAERLDILRAPAEGPKPPGVMLRTGRSTESVRLLISGARGSGGFPAPIAAINHKTLVWSWAEVCWWWADTLGDPLGDGENARYIARVNLALQEAALESEIPSVAGLGYQSSGRDLAA